MVLYVSAVASHSVCYVEMSGILSVQAIEAQMKRSTGSGNKD